MSRALGILALIPAGELAFFFLLAHWWGYSAAFTISWVSWLAGIAVAVVGIRRWWLTRRARWRGGTVDLADAPDLLGVLIAGVLLVIPGPLTGLLGACLLIAPVRRWLLKATARRAVSRVMARR